MTYNPNDLDPSLVEAAARMSAKFHELAKDKPSDVASKYPVPPVTGPLEGWAKDPFFDPAVALSGQDLGLIEALYDVIADVWAQSDYRVRGYVEGMNHIFGKWEGTAARDCAIYTGNLEGAVHDQQQCLFTLARGLTTYAAIIQRSRESLRDLMNKCVDGWIQAGHAAEAANLSINTALITAASGMGFTVITGGTGALTLPGWGSALMGIAGSITNNGPTLDLVGLSGDIATTFLSGAQELLAQTAEAIDHTARPDLDRARDILPQVPALPGGITDKTQFYPEPGAPGSGQPSKISKALD